MRLVALAAGCVAIASWTGATAQRTTTPPPPVDATTQAQIDALVSEGDQLAAAKDYAGAIERYKRADQLAPRALHACLIAAAYYRRGLWPQAELFFSECHARDAAGDAAPKWLPASEGEMNAKLTAAPVAEVTVAVEPADADARVKLSGFAPDESFAPRMIHLPLGQHTVTVTAPGFAAATETFDVDRAEPRTLTITLHPPAAPLPAPVRPPRVHRSLVPWMVIGAGGVIAIGGGVYHATVLRGAYRDLEATTDHDFYDGAGDGAWRSARRNTIIFYSVAAATIATGVALRSLGVGDRREVAFALGVSPADGGGLVTVGWER